MKVPTNVMIQLDVRADTPQDLPAALRMVAMALAEDLGPNTIWGEHYCVGIRLGDRP